MAKIGVQSVAEAPFDAEDLARILTGFRGQPQTTIPPMRYVRRPGDGDSSMYVLDEKRLMVYLLA